jgi:hypothetical protein
MAGATDEQITSMMGSTQEYWIKDGNYKSSLNGTFLQWQLYINKENKLYSKMSNSESIFWNDGAVNPDEVLKVEVNKNVMEVLGEPCHELILTCKSGTQKYYFNEKIKVDPTLFENHKFGNWSEVISRSGSIPLKMVIDTPRFSIVSTALSVTPAKLADDLFQLPVGAKIEKSPF